MDVEESTGYENGGADAERPEAAPSAGAASLSVAWFLLRQFVISATGAYKAAGWSRMVSFLHYWMHLVFDPQQKNEDSPIMAHGRRNENNCLAALTDITGLAVSEAPFRRHPDIYWLAATPDGLVKNDFYRGGQPSLVECKCPFWRPYDTPPFEYLVQMFVQMAVYAIPCNYLVCWFRGRCRRVWRVHWNERFWAFLMIRMTIFWQCVEGRVPPDYLLVNAGVACEEFAKVNFDEKQRVRIAKEQGLRPSDLPPGIFIETVHFEPYVPETMKPTEEELREHNEWMLEKQRQNERVVG